MVSLIKLVINQKKLFDSEQYCEGILKRETLKRLENILNFYRF